MNVPVTKNQTVALCPDAVNEAGDGVSRLDGGFVIFAKGLLPGERAAGKIIKVSQNYAVARVVSRDNDSELRRKDPCPYALKGCGGCAFAHVTEEGQLSFARRRVTDCLARIGGFDPEEAEKLTAPCLAPRGNIYRNKTVYPFFNDGGACRTGFYARASHRPVLFEPGAPCPHENPLAARIRETVETLAAGFGYDAYDEVTGRGLIRHLTVRVSDWSSTAMAVLSVNARKLPREAEFVSKLTAAVPGIASLYLDANTSPGNAVSAGDFRLLSGSEKLECRIGPARFLISPASFFQVSTAGAETLYDAVFRLFKARSGQRVYDLYCGAGTIGIYLLKRFFEELEERAPGGGGTEMRGGAAGGELPRLVGVEIVPEAVDNARDNALLNGLKGCRFIAGDVPRIIGADSEKADTVIIDPPRKGTTPELISSLLALAPLDIIYVSCNPATLARDLKEFCAGGNYRVASVQPVDMFPDTGHVETVVLLSREKQ
jgi:23S rRNA (uracil1939-C5)-methyltransferase